jgi:transposase
MLAAREEVSKRVTILARKVMRTARASEVGKRLMTAPGVGGVVAPAVWSAIDDPLRFAKPFDVGAYFELTPRRYASGEIGRSGRVSKCGDKDVRKHLYEAANVLLTRIRHPSALQAWSLAIAIRSGFKKAKVAVARGCQEARAVILHRLWRDPTDFRLESAAARTA